MSYMFDKIGSASELKGVCNLDQLNDAITAGDKYILLASSTITLTGALIVPAGTTIKGSNSIIALADNTITLGNNCELNEITINYTNNGAGSPDANVDTGTGCKIINCEFSILGSTSNEYITANDDCVINKCIFNTNSDIGIDITGVRCQIDLCKFIEILADILYCNGIGASISNCQISGGSGTIRMLADNCTLSDIIIHGSNISTIIFVSGDNITINNCIIYDAISNIRAIDIFSSTNCNLIGNIIKNTIGDGIQIRGASKCNVNGNTIKNIGGSAIIVEDISGEVVISGNTLQDNPFSGIISSGICNITGNKITGNTNNITINNNSGSTFINSNIFIPLTTTDVVPDDNILVGTAGNSRTVKVGDNKSNKIFTTTTASISGYNDFIELQGVIVGTLNVPDITTTSKGHRLSILMNNGSGSPTDFTLTSTTSISSFFLNDTQEVSLIWTGTYWKIDAQVDPINLNISYNSIYSNRHMNVNQSLPISSTGVIIQYDKIVSENGISYSGGQFTFQHAGLYFIQYSGYLTQLSGSSGHALWIRYTGDIGTLYGYFGRTGTWDASNSFIGGGSAILNCKVGEIVYVRGRTYSVVRNYTAQSGGDDAGLITIGRIG